MVNTVHGLIDRKEEYEAWSGAKKRCYNTSMKAYPRYGGRGITMDPRWLNDFATFYSDMGPRPSNRHSLDRIDNDGPYSPDNCRWATRKRQGRNKSNNVVVTYQGRRMTLSDACELAAVPFDRVQARIKYLGWDFDRAVSEPPRGFAKSRAPIRSRGFSPTRGPLWPVNATEEHEASSE